MADAGHRVDSGPPFDAGPDISNVVIYAHSRDTLFVFSPQTLRVDPVGVFELSSGEPAPFMLDLAVDAEGNVFTSSDDALFRVDPETAVVTEVGSFGLGEEQLFALTFLVAGELGETEALVGATNAGVLYRVDPLTASATPIGNYPEGWLSSGDLVSIEGLGTYATLKRNDFPSDVLARVLFSSSGATTVTVLGPVRNATTDYTQLFGLGYWGRSLYGFSNSGQLIEINRDTGAARPVSTDTGTSQFWGAGVTTRAPVLI